MGNIKIYFNGSQITINKDSYQYAPINKQRIKETEGGTLRRYIKRLGVPNISISMPASESEYATIYSAYTSGSTITVKHYNPGTGALETFYGIVEDLVADLVYETSTTTEWNISFKITSM